MNRAAWLLGAWLLGASLACGANVAAAADAPREAHGSADGFALPGVMLAWGVLRGVNEAATTVVVRIVTEPASYPWLAVAGIDPFAKAEQPLLPATGSTGALDVRIPRAQFADTPRTEIRLYPSAAAARGAAPSLVIFYHGVPDTTPEFADAAKLEAHLAARIAALRATGGQAP